MKFALQADGGAAAAGQGIGNLFKAYAMGDLYRQKAEDESLLNTARMTALQSQALASEAAAEANRTKAALGQQQLKLQQNPLESAMLNLGLPTALAPAFKQRLETGSFGPSYEAPADGVGPIQPPPATPETVAELGRAMSLLQRMIATDSKVNQGTDAALDEQRYRGIEAVLKNPALAGNYGRANAAAAGKPLFDNVQDTGYSIDNFSGAQTQGNPALAKLFGNAQAALANQRNAAARKSSVDADLDQFKLDTGRKTGVLPGSGEAGEGALSNTILNTLLIPAVDDKGRPVRNPQTNELERVIDQKALASFYGWVASNNKRPTAAQFAQWEAQGRPTATAPGAGGNKNPAAAAGGQTIQPQETKTIGGKTYVKVNGKWFEQ